MAESASLAGRPGMMRSRFLGTSQVYQSRKPTIAAVNGASVGAGFSLALYDGWRSPETVRALYEHFYGPGSTLAPGFLADPDDPAVIPPHTTGAAVDLALALDGDALALGTFFDDFTDAAHLTACERPGADPLARALRRVLHAAMTDAGFAPNPTEWWHWSYGDQAWAARTGAVTARFGPVRP